MVIDPAGEDRSFHRHCPGLRQSLDPLIQLPTCCPDLTFLADPAARIFHTVADGLLVHIKSDVIHMSFEEPPWLWSESTCPLSSAFCTPRAPRGLSIQTVSRRVGQRKARTNLSCTLLHRCGCRCWEGGQKLQTGQDGSVTLRFQLQVASHFA